ncbi:uncharacterized protein DNG_09991 [Cephalotrichum gorgonifer]|uniref:Uncharacterized protein n=1 Tax=Cephalotrichum gorgonifer TaxID=2041049 RepID=A0AAE8N6W8_9PEZI|nr:uncharacterized protein DNG_09991 [Cephalotrichum gorgonifer]
MGDDLDESYFVEVPRAGTIATATATATVDLVLYKIEI